jgi:SAM-dependent methyltransferase
LQPPPVRERIDEPPLRRRERHGERARLSYALGDSEVAAERLELVARIFEPASRALLREVGPAAVDLAVDLGCGPGHTTALLAEVLRCRRTVGLDLSPRFIAQARRFASGRVEFRVHDVTVVPFPVGPTELLYGRLLLTHLKDPLLVIERWAGELVPGGLLVVEEVESIATSSPVLGRYLAILDRMLRSQSNQLYIGAELEGAPVPPRLAKRRSGIREHPVSPADAAAMFALNLRTWRDHRFVRERVEEREIERLERDLDSMRSGATAGVEIVWKLRNLVYQRT